MEFNNSGAYFALQEQQIFIMAEFSRDTWVTFSTYNSIHHNPNPNFSPFSVPTFIGFLKEIESPKEVKDYVKLYIGEGKQAINFANQYLEKRQAFNEPDNVNNFIAIKANHKEQSKSKSKSNDIKKTTEFVEVKVRNKIKLKNFY